MDYSRELFRKTFHLGATIFPVSYCLLPRNILLYILIPLSISAFLFDMLRFRVKFINRFFVKFTGLILREHEQKTFNGTTWLVSSFTIIIIFFPKPIVVSSMLFLIIGDTLAALIGKKFGKTRIGKKSLEGSLAFLLSSFIIVFFVMPGQLIVGVCGAVVATVVEFNPGKFDDNFLIPITASMTMYAASFVF